MKQHLFNASIELVLEYKDHFRDMLLKHNGKHPETGNPSLKHIKDKSSFFKELKSSWAAKKMQKSKK